MATTPNISAVPDPEDRWDGNLTQDLALHEEQAVLGTAMQSRAAFVRISGCSPDLRFEHSAHDQVWRALGSLAAQSSAPFEPPALLDALISCSTRTVRFPDPASLLNDCLKQGTLVESAIYYATRMRDRARLAEARCAIVRVTQRLDQINDPADTSEVIQTAFEELATLRDTFPTDRDEGGWGPNHLITEALDGVDTSPVPTMLVNSAGIASVYPGRLHSISGEPESGKTWIALAAASQVLCEGGRVVLLDFEDTAQAAVSRLRTLGVAPEIIRTNLEYRHPIDALTSAARAALIPSIKNADLVILDGVTEAMAVHGLDLNSNEDAARFYGHMRWIARHGPAVVMLDHVTKSREGRGHHAIGAQHKLAGIDGVALTVVRNEPFRPGGVGRATVRIAKDRHGAVRAGCGGQVFAQFTLDTTRAEPTWAIASAVSVEPGAKKQREIPRCESAILTFLEDRPRTSTNAIETGVEHGHATVRTALANLLKDGAVTTEKGPRGAILYAVTEAK